MATKEEDFLEHLFISTTHHNILFFTNLGRVYRIKGYDIPEASRTAKGAAIVNVLPLEKQEKITAVIPVKEFQADKYLFMATNQGTVKKTELLDFDTARKTGLIAINLEEKEQLIAVRMTTGEAEILLGTRNGLAIRFAETDVRSMGRTARGVRGIALGKDDEVVAMEVVVADGDVLTVSEDGLGKRTMVSEYRIQTRGGKGIINLKVTEKTGPVVGFRIVRPEQEMMLITVDGIIIRFEVDEVSVFGRNSQGVKLMRLDEGDKVVALAAVQRKMSDD